ncbi:MAG: hypothetical protein ACREOW_13960 [Thermodesulfobacteriota bacterium]
MFDQNGLKPDDIRSVADLSAIPITSKKDLQSLPAKEVVALGLDPKQLITHTTSGSSGEPFTLRHTWFEERLFELFRLRTMLYFGLRFTDRQVSIGLIRPTHPRNYQLPLKVLQALGLLRRGLINCLLPPQEIVRALRDLKPDVLTGYSGVLSRISHFPEGA